MIEFVLGSAVVGVAGVGAWMVVTHNRLVALDQRCKTAFSDIDVLLKHRHSVLPGLIESVRGFVGHERGILDGIANARSEALSSKSPEAVLKAEVNLTKRVRSLIQTAETYPELKASEHFRELRHEIGDAENKITAARRFFNLAVEEYCTTARQFPGSFIASKFRLTQREPIDIGIDRILLDEPVAVKF